MPHLAVRKFQLPTSTEVGLAKKCISELDAIQKLAGARFLQISATNTLEIPENIFQAVIEMMQMVANGKGFSLSSIEKELGTQEAADLLQISRPFLVKLLDEGKIPYRYVGRYRRIRQEDLLAYTNGTHMPSVLHSVESKRTNGAVANSHYNIMMDLDKELEEARREARLGDINHD